MKQSLFIFAIIFLSTGAYALEGIESLEKKIYEKNQDFISLQMQAESKQALSQSTSSGFYPTLNAVGGWGQNKTDDLLVTEKGYVGYLEGKFNLFHGFKDQSVANQKEVDLKITNLELELKRRDLKADLTEIASSMIFLHKLQSILEEEYKVTQSQKQMAAKKVAAGLTGSVDNLEFELRENEIQIEQKQIVQQHEEAHQNFIRLYGENISDAELEKLDFSNAEQLIKTIDQIKVDFNLQYQIANFQQEKAAFEKQEIKSDYLPSIDFTYSAGRITPSDDTPAKFNESKYALLITIPLFSGFDTFYKTKAANLAFQSSEKIKNQQHNQITADFNILKTKIKQLAALYEINQQKLITSQKYFDLTLSEYKRGIKNSPDLVTATERLFSSKKQKYTLLKDLELLKVKIENLN